LGAGGGGLRHRLEAVEHRHALLADVVEAGRDLLRGPAAVSLRIARTSAGWFHTAIVPPLAVYTWPVTCRAASARRNTTIGATSSGSPISRPNGTLPDMRLLATGAITLAVTPYLWRPRAALRVSDTIPPFAAL